MSPHVKPPRLWAMLPLAALLALVALFAFALRHDPRALPSALIGHPAPAFAAPSLQDPSSLLHSRSLHGRPWVLHVWASWCDTCQAEHAVVRKLAQGPLPVYGLNYKDASSDALAWLQRMGDPYRRSVADPHGRIGMDYGVYGVPETFVIDRHGRVRYRHAGPLTEALLDAKLRPLMAELAQGG